MNTDYAYEMYRRLLASTLAHADFTAETSFRLKQIAEKNHVADGYFSWDGMLDDIAEMIGDSELASEILNQC